MDHQSRFQDIVLRHLNDPENQSLVEEVDRMRNLSVDREKEYQDIKKLWELSARTTSLYTLDEQRSVRNLKAKMGLTAIGKSRKLYGWLSTAAAVLLVAGISTWYLIERGKTDFLIKETTAGVIDSVLLADGSRVYLAENTTVRYPQKFKEDIRPVVLVRGQAFFKVTKDAKHPFQVSINNSVVKVLGTSFNINYTIDKINLSVKTGRVMFTPNTKSESSILSAGEALTYDLNKNLLSKENGLNSTSWLTHELQFVDMPLEEVCKQLSDYYKVKVVLLAEMANAKKLNANFSNTSIDEVLKVLKQIYPIQIEKKDSTIYVRNL
jgi:transmembrane sensor